MAIDLSALLGGGAGTATMSPLAMYKKLQKTAAENEAARNGETDAAKAAEVSRQFNNAAIRLRNSQYREENARIESDLNYFRNRAATATTATELVNDDRFLKVLAYSNGFGDLYNTDKQRLRDILSSDLSNPASVARQGTLKELEFAQKYNFGATGNQVDTNGDPVGYDVDGKLVNGATVVTPLPAALSKLRRLAIDVNGEAILSSNKLVAGPDLVTRDITAYSNAYRKALLQEQAAPVKASSLAYEFAGPEFEKFRARKDVQSEIEYYRENIKDITSLDDLFNNQRLLKFFLSSYDLESEVQYPGKIRKIIESDLTDVDSLANRFQDPRFQQMAREVSFNMLGIAKLKMGSTTEDVVRRYERLAYERDLDQQAPGVRAAIEFERRIKDVNKTIQLLGDSVLREVVTVANNIRKELAYQEVDSQVTALEKRINVTELKNDPTAIEKTVLRYLTFKDNGGGTGGSQSYLLNLFG